jgi:hypothetical protein
LQNGVTEEFEALIIEMIAPGFVPDAGMGERLDQQKWVSKFVANAFFERSHGLAILSETEESLNLIRGTSTRLGNGGAADSTRPQAIVGSCSSPYRF